MDHTTPPEDRLTRAASDLQHMPYNTFTANMRALRDKGYALTNREEADALLLARAGYITVGGNHT